MAAQSPRDALNRREVKTTIAKSIFIPFPSFTPSEQRPKDPQSCLDQTIHNLNTHHAAVRKNIICSGRQAIEHPVEDIPQCAPGDAYLSAINYSVITSLDSNPNQDNPDGLIKLKAPSPPPITDDNVEAFEWSISHPIAVTLHTQAALEEYKSHSRTIIEGYRQILQRSTLPSHPTNLNFNRSQPGPSPLSRRRTLSHDQGAPRPASATNTTPCQAPFHRPSNDEGPRRGSMAGPIPSPMEDGRSTTPARYFVAPTAPMMTFTGSGLRSSQMPARTQTQMPAQMQARTPMPTQMQGQTPTPTQRQGPRTPASNVVDASRDPRQRR
ncbi:hypothetical protein K490DRAFT_67309 [Saccharata proteae CBS 121410]|uniref:Uncharacterized protein n=1 Tax=Saccharata proteae CBS 121410 TaxID=1314787 RepID=A0A9P4LTN7_9PEZI|nr:hypothetical protein K490DRAFT_67309 [Saccharata proteae CBS 121410]